MSKTFGILPYSLTMAVTLLLVACGEDRRPISGAAPSVTLDSFAGKRFTLNPSEKDATLLVFWASWCGPCIMEIPALIRLHEKYSGSSVQVVSINVDEPEKLDQARSLAKKYGINYPTLIGSETTMRDWSVQALPTSFLIGKDGRIREKLQGLRSAEELEAKVQALLGTQG